ncbi:transcriptional corepressor SEUSS-like [Impatiens glandulifera]|uniref:transcriptional corepressor SEUSS-like n=1 Tax=Impatiens glandulifera TaxID=253017 RepID=UPI001FB14F63|nr:transcriptional corepressor SEUSS-like [Impatiens glandulifera]
MVPSGPPPTPIGAGQTVQSNSGLMGGAQGGGVQSGFPPLVSPRLQFSNVNMMGNPNMSLLVQPSFGNVSSPNTGLSGPGNSQRGVMGTGSDSDQLLATRNAMEFNPNQSSFTAASNIANNRPDQGQGQGQGQGQLFSTSSANQIFPNQQQSQQQSFASQNLQRIQQPLQQSFASQNLQRIQQPLQQSSASQNLQQIQLPLQQSSPPQNLQQTQQPLQQSSTSQNIHQQQYQSIRGGLAGTDQHFQPSQQLQPLRNLGPQQIQAIRNLASVKMEPSQHPDQSLFLHPQQQQQQLLHQQHQQQQLVHMSRKSPQSAAHFNNLVQLQQLQQQQQQKSQQHHQQQQPQQQHALKAIPSRPPSTQSQFQTQSLPVRPPGKPVYETGMCARRLTHYMYQQQHRPEDNNIEFWRKFVEEYFAPNAKKRWCVSMYGSGRQTSGVFPQDVWHCEICNRKPGRGFEATVEVLPRLLKIKYESGTLEELLYVDMPREYQNASGHIVLHYFKAIQESVFDQLRVVRDGQLRIVFNSDLKICSWEFCARHHEELIPRRLMIPQVSQLGAAAQKYQAATQNGTSSMSVPELQNTCNMFVTSARQLAKSLEVPLVNDLGYTKRYIRCLQIAEVVNSMTDLIESSAEKGTGPMDSLARYSGSGNPAQKQQTEEQAQQQQINPSVPNSNNNEERSEQVTTAATNSAPVLLKQTSMTRSQTSITNNGPLGGLGVQIPSPSSSAQPNPSPFHSPTVSSSNNKNPNQISHGGLAAPVNVTSANARNFSIQQASLSGDADPSLVQKIFNEMMMQNGGPGLRNVNGMMQTNNMTGHNNGGNLFAANGTAMNSSGMTGAPFGSFGNHSATMNGMQGAINGNGNGNRSAMTLNGQIASQQNMNNQQQQQGSASGDQQLLNNIGALNGFNNNLQFDWRSSP